MNVSVKQLPELKRRVLSPKQKTQPNQKLGQAGEKRAGIFLQQHGYRILQTNIWLPQGEIDILAFDPSTKELVFCEVKTRQSDHFGHPSQMVSPRQLRAARRAATIISQRFKLTNDFRFDIIAVLPGKIDHFQNVSW